jgi:hypothetical protein
MKKYLIFILTILMCACSPNTRQKDSDTEKIINILDERDFVKKKFEFHKDKEVRIYGSTYRMEGSESPNYALRVYLKGKQRGNFIFEGHDKYDKAALKWINDTTLIFRLFNSSNSLSESISYTYKIKKNGGEELGINRN